MISPILSAYKNYFNFRGRASRKDFWLFQIWGVVYYIISIFLMIELFNYFDRDLISNIIAISLVVIWLIPNISLIVRRLHDTNRSGFWFFLIFAACIGAMVVLVFLCQKGTDGPNDYDKKPTPEPEENVPEL